MAPKASNREFQGKDISLQSEFPNMRMANTIQPARLSPPEHEENVKRSFRRPEGPKIGVPGGRIEGPNISIGGGFNERRIEGPNMNIGGGFNERRLEGPNINIPGGGFNERRIEGPNIRVSGGGFNERRIEGPNINIPGGGFHEHRIEGPKMNIAYEEPPKRSLMTRPQYEVPHFGREDVNLRMEGATQFQGTGPQTGQVQYDVPKFGGSQEEFSKRVDITRIDNQEPRANFGRGEKVKRSGFNQGQEEQGNQFYFNNKGGQNQANLTGSYVRAGGNKNDEYLRKTYNYYGEYRDKSNVRIYFVCRSFECFYTGKRTKSLIGWIQRIRSKN